MPYSQYNSDAEQLEAWLESMTHQRDTLARRVEELEVNTAIVAFLERPDICVEEDPHGIYTVFQEPDDFSGTADNVITAARMAMLQERKWKAAVVAEEKGRKEG